MIQSEFFVVGCEGISFHNGVVMIDLARLSVTNKDDQGQPQREFSHRLVTTPPGMLEMFNAMQGMLNKLVEVGLLTRREDGQGAEPVADTGQPAGDGQTETT